MALEISVVSEGLQDPLTIDFSANMAAPCPQLGAQHAPKLDQKWSQNELKTNQKLKSCINGYKIKKKNGVMHAVVFVDGAPEAKNAQVVGRLRNSEGLKMRKKCDRNGQRTDRS